MAKNIKISFTLDESDAAYFRNLYRRARREAAGQDPSVVIGEVRSLIASFRGAKKAPSVVTETVGTLEDLIEMLEDKDYSVPKRVADQVVAGLSYFANPSDLIPDQIPGLGFIDDAIMIKLVEEEFGHELWGYRKFRNFRKGAEQRPWTPIARERMPRRLAEQRQKIRSEVDRRKKESKRGFSW
jgi:uncharacterized membrane protein YkvA (DUF1232 family)